MSDDAAAASGWWRLDGVLGHLLDRWLSDRDRLIDLLRRAETRHLVDEDTLSMMEGALQVSEMQVRDIMVPRSLMVTVPETDDPQALLPIVVESGHSRFPVMDHRHEKVVGILLAKELLSIIAQGEEARFRLQEILRPAVFVPESKRLNVLLREFRASRNHLAIVVDEYGSPAGLVSIEDVIEQIVGEIDDEYDSADEDFVRRLRGNRYTVRACMPIVDFNAFFGAALPDHESDTIGGLVSLRFGSPPRRGDTLELGEFTFTVQRADKHQVHTMRVTHHLAPPSDAPPDD